MPDPDKFTPRELRFIEALRQAALSNYPNPDRVGCPDQKTLEAAAKRQVPMMDPVIDHIWQCSPCAQEVLRIRQSGGRRRIWAMSGAIAAVVVMGLGFLLWQRTKPDNLATGANPAISKTPSPSVVMATLDLRPYSVTRGRAGDPQIEPTLRREPLSLAMYLPVGSEEGRYELRIMNSDLQTVLTQNVEAKLAEQVVTISTDLDLRSFQPGRYSLALRPSGGDWRTYPMTVE
jgi:hypothetical protein